VISNKMPEGAVSHPGIALTFGFVVAAMIFALGPISAAHFNPAVTLGFVAARRFPWRHVPAYLGAQAAGAVGASLLHGLFTARSWPAVRAMAPPLPPSCPAPLPASRSSSLSCLCW
jgi:glycerol uptake facilitator-like aquaporin